MDKLQKHWEELGETEAYYAVLTYDKFRAEKLTDNVREDFFRTGEDHIGQVWVEIEKHFVSDFSPKRSLDFGCGVGRLVVSLSPRSGEVVGVDISRKMLEESARNCEVRALTNAKFMLTEEMLGSKDEKFDFIHSFIVFQHIKPKEGEAILDAILDKLNEGGIGALHFTYRDDSPTVSKLKTRIYRDLPLANSVKDLLKGGADQPLIPIYHYELSNIFGILQRHNCDKSFIRLTDHGMKGAFIFFQKGSDLKYQF